MHRSRGGAWNLYSATDTCTQTANYSGQVETTNKLMYPIKDRWNIYIPSNVCVPPTKKERLRMIECLDFPVVWFFLFYIMLMHNILRLRVDFLVNL